MCKFNDGIHCLLVGSSCERCGWNPNNNELHDRRVNAVLQDKYAKEFPPDEDAAEPQLASE